jgi:hypothetical protein
MITLTEVSRETYGHDERAINKHAERRYKDAHGNVYVLSRTLDGIPPFFEAYGPFEECYSGLLPRLKVGGQEYWGSGWSWQRAVAAFCSELQAVIRSQ